MLKTNHLRLLVHESQIRGINPLETAYKKAGINTSCFAFSNIKELLEKLDLSDELCSGILVVDSEFRGEALRKGPFVYMNGSKIPLSHLTILNESTLEVFTSSLWEVHKRARSTQIIALLCQRFPRYLKTLDKMWVELKSIEEIDTFNWAGDLVYKEDLIEGLQGGVGCAIYLGHGRNNGWVGYYGTRIKDFKDTDIRPMGALISLCCKTGINSREEQSFSQEIVARGISISGFGAISDTKHTDNTRWAVNMSKALKKGVGNISELVLNALPSNPSAWRDYCLFGDPFAPLHTDQLAFEFADNVNVYS